MIKFNTLMSKFKINFTSKISILTVALTLVWILTDINQRLSTDVKEKNKQAIINDIIALPLPQVTNDLQQQLQQELTPYSDNANQQGDNSNLLTAEQKAQQQGELTTFYFGEQSIELKAVINSTTGQGATTSTNDERLAALLLVTNLKTNVASIERFNNNDSVYGFTLNIQKNTQAILTKDDSTGKQKVILTMFIK